jgi:ubiquitin C-terminal hydrolase
MAKAIGRYVSELIPPVFGLINTGSTCYFNSLVQALVSCPSFIVTVINNRDILSETSIGQRLFALCESISTKSSGIESHAAMLQATLAACAEKRDVNPSFGHGQESASEAFYYLMECLVKQDMRPDTSGERTPIDSIFTYGTRNYVLCGQCKKVAIETRDRGIIFSLFYFDYLKETPTNADFFVKALKTQASLEKAGDFKCPHCGEKGTSLHVAQLTMLSDIAIFSFNIYRSRQKHFTPSFFTIEGTADNMLYYIKVAQILHFGSLGGGHYICHCIRSNGVYQISDQSISRIHGLEDSENVYLVIYHYLGSVSKTAERSEIAKLFTDCNQPVPPELMPEVHA